MIFSAFNPIVKQLRTDNSYRIELDVPESDYHEFCTLSSPALKGKVLKVRIEIEDDNGIDDALPSVTVEPADPRRRLEARIQSYCEQFGGTRETLKQLWITQGIIESSTKELSDDQLNELSDSLWTSIKTDVA